MNWPVFTLRLLKANIMIRFFAGFLLITVLSVTGNTQILAQVRMKYSVEGICDQDEVYALYNGFEGQVAPKCTLSKAQMQKMLNEKLDFLRENPKFSSKGMVGVFINCEGKAVQWDIAVKTKSSELDQQILTVFESFSEWFAGKLDGKAVDARVLFSYEIKKGVIKLN